MNSSSPYSSKTTEQKMHERHAGLKDSEQEIKASEEAQKHAKTKKACIAFCHYKSYINIDTCITSLQVS